jgi:hypothetical protein
LFVGWEAVITLAKIDLGAVNPVGVNDNEGIIPAVIMLGVNTFLPTMPKIDTRAWSQSGYIMGSKIAPFLAPNLCPVGRIVDVMTDKAMRARGRQMPALSAHCCSLCTFGSAWARFP